MFIKKDQQKPEGDFLAPFANEAVTCRSAYLSGYKAIPKVAPFNTVLQDLQRQAEYLNTILGVRKSFNQDWGRFVWQNLPPQTEKLFVVPVWHKIAPTYNEAMKVAFDFLKVRLKEKFEKRVDIISEDAKIVQTEKNYRSLETLWGLQGNPDFMLVPGQLGLCYGGFSSRRVDTRMKVNEAIMDPWTFICTLLTHENRLAQDGDLWAYCAGAQYKSKQSEGIVGFFYFEEKLVAQIFNEGDLSVNYGVPSISVPCSLG